MPPLAIVIFVKNKNTMGQLILEFSNQDDLMMLLSFAKRLNARIVSVKQEEKTSGKKAVEDRLELLQQAAQDPLFLADVAEVMDDFAHADQDVL